jgi:hypothetical protein
MEHLILMPLSGDLLDKHSHIQPHIGRTILIISQAYFTPQDYQPIIRFVLLENKGHQLESDVEIAWKSWINGCIRETQVKGLAAIISKFKGNHASEHDLPIYNALYNARIEFRYH